MNGLATLATATVTGATTLSSTLTVTRLTTLSDDVSMTKPVAAITHTGTSLTISSNAYVDIESVRFTGADIGVDTAANIITLSNAAGVASASVTGKLSATSDFAVGLAGLHKFTVAAGSGDTTIKGTLDVTGATRLTSLTTGTLSTTGNFAVGGTQFQVDSTNGNTVVAGTLDVTGATKLRDNLVMVNNIAAISHTGTSLTISSNAYVDVENVRFTGPNIGVNNAASIITLATTGAGGRQVRA